MWMCGATSIYTFALHVPGQINCVSGQSLAEGSESVYVHNDVNNLRPIVLLVNFEFHLLSLFERARLSTSFGPSSAIVASFKEIF